MIKKVATTIEIKQTSELAHKIWHQYYTPIIGKEQVKYMLDKFQSVTAITTQIKNGYAYYLLENNSTAIGYLAVVPNAETSKLMISKIYVDTTVRGFGYGVELLEFAIAFCKEKELETIWLTVNKNNTSVKWYQKRDFKIIKEVTMDIGNGFFMDDYIMELIIIP